MKTTMLSYITATCDREACETCRDGIILFRLSMHARWKLFTFKGANVKMKEIGSKEFCCRAECHVLSIII